MTEAGSRSTLAFESTPPASFLAKQFWRGRRLRFASASNSGLIPGLRNLTGYAADCRGEVNTPPDLFSANDSLAPAVRWACPLTSADESLSPAVSSMVRSSPELPLM